MYSKISSLAGNLKILGLLKLLIVSNIQYNVFKIRYEGRTYIWNIYSLHCPIGKISKINKISFESWLQPLCT